MPVSTVGIDVEHRADGAYLTVATPDGVAKIGPVDLAQDACLTGVFEQPKGARKKPNPKKQRRRSMKQEEEIASRSVDGFRVHGSGALPGSKGDVRVPGKFRYEAKYTRAKSYTVEARELRKIRAEATGDEVPVFEVHFLDTNGKAEERWVLLDVRHFQHMKYKPPYATTHDS